MRFTSYFILLHRLAALTYSTPISDTADIETSPTLPKRTSGSPAHSPPTIPVYVPPSYIWEPNNATCRAMLTYSVGEMFESTYLGLEIRVLQRNGRLA
ncbi:uncharacterized protein LY89DRAFT_691673 [Mollisia scopiformis]|uniref:Uncharacterized protein n=1 Tax=Mollisia scopiformis TaxID=149040 RepID=A0A132B5A3_MOLSC|nr:uncharacterized protein LY89DRAFT_691673 [Mollisia scopiformis]KUJ07590.1 hypothetical protein LY89DRAFT_691673 [Mollisia scopiformis]